MPRDERNVLDVLKAELNFLNKAAPHNCAAGHRASAKNHRDGLGARGKDFGKTTTRQDTKGHHVSQSSSEVREPRMRFSI